MVHQGPSSIGIDTVYASQGRIPEVFLRGAGVPDEFITYMRSLVARPIEFYSCFISYSSKDQEFAERLHADLQARGVRCWFAPEDIQGGRKLHEQIEQAIRHYDKLLLVLSEHSMGSEWVKTEIYHARQDEMRSRRRKLFPISLVDFRTVREWTAFDADTGKDMGREVREYFVPDFSSLEGPRRVQEGVRPAAARPQGRGTARLVSTLTGAIQVLKHRALKKLREYCAERKCCVAGSPPRPGGRHASAVIGPFPVHANRQAVGSSQPLLGR